MNPVTTRPRQPSPRLLLALTLLCAGLGGPTRAWNPYDTDSAEGRGDPNPWFGAAPMDTAPSAPAQGWSGQRATGGGDAPAWGASARWPVTGDGSAAPTDFPALPGRPRFRPNGEADSTSAPLGLRADPGPAPLTGAPALAPGADAPPPGGGDDEWAARERARYRFRGDSEFSGATPGPDAATGYSYRPLTGKEQERHRPESESPRWRDGDLQPRGPSWGIEDAGSAVGYEPDGPGDRNPAAEGLR